MPFLDDILPILCVSWINLLLGGVFFAPRDLTLQGFFVRIKNIYPWWWSTVETFPASENLVSHQRTEMRKLREGEGGSPHHLTAGKSIWFEIAHTAKVEVVGVPGKGNLFYFCLLAL